MVASEPPGVPSHADLVRLLLTSGAVRFGTFTLASGQTSDVYVDIKRAWTDPATLRTLGRALARRVAGAERLAGMELGAVPRVVAVALETGLPYAGIRKAAKAHGSRQLFEWELAAGAHVVVVEDVSTTGGSSVETVEIVRAAGATVERVVAVVDREMGAAERLAGIDVRLEALVTVDELRGART